MTSTARFAVAALLCAGVSGACVGVIDGPSVTQGPPQPADTGTPPGDTGEPPPDDTGAPPPPDDTGAPPPPDDTGAPPPDDTGAPPPPLDTGPPPTTDYPAGPYGKSVGSVVSNFSWMGYRDSTGAWTTIKMADYYDPTGSKGIRAVWLGMAAVW